MELRELCKKIFEENREHIFDIVYHPKEREIFVITRTSEPAFFREIERAFSNFRKNIEIEFSDLFSMLEEQNKMIEEIFNSESLINERPFLEHFGFNLFVEFRYSLENLNQSDKMMFNYALEGRRGMKGILHHLNGMKIAKSVVLVPKENEKKFEAFLNSRKIKYVKRNVIYKEV
ncbi:MAG: hypothetical protein OH319_00855 [Candidatus Parvarchaeota archaeon]|nr:hypothetical protein [Candidatus Jingweiarchaeum tengchongense]MCW1297873.1 hypothetical protein [Candidatus Jingweiarchaeum tengchongense]MCW1299884.1 hypothetical protein [Candidatus Jingweiarchaeum tengchongense]MCW1305112.1 hypothetical protein [Candidatus Jingweiarchaeum tengchongense]MCW1305174.1 hypothetical protein [Candidatus Jingweiarchaeum tengchongense]